MKFLNRNNRIFLKNFKAKIPFLAVVFAFIFCVNYAQSAFNEQINYQGKLTDSTGQVVADGDYNIEFKLYTTVTGGSPVWTETCDDTDKITVTNGLFSHLLGSVTALDDSIFNQDLYLSVNIGGTSTPSWDGEMTPRKKLGSVASAFEAKRLAGKLESQFGGIAETETVSGLWTFSATTTFATTTVSSSTITTLYATTLNVNGTSSTLWDQAYNYFNASSTNLDTTHFIVNSSSTNWDWTHNYVNASSSNWDIAYVKGLNAYSYAHATSTENVAGLEFSGQQLNLTTGYEIPTTASTTDWTSSSVALNANDSNWTSAYSQAHATATESITGIDLTGQAFSLTSGYIIPLSASTTNWNNAYNTVNSSSSNWDIAYVKGLSAYSQAHATATESITGIDLTGQAFSLTSGYEIPTTASTTDWTSSSVALNTNDSNWTSAYSQAHATATESITGIDLTGQAFSLTSGYIIPLSASTTNWNNAYDIVNASSSNWDIAYVKGLSAYSQAHATATESITGIDLTGQAFSLTSGYEIPTTASTTDWTSSSVALNTNDSNWTYAYSYAHATATEDVVGLEFTGQVLGTTSGYVIPLSASTTNWTSAYDIVNSSSTSWDAVYNKMSGTMTDAKYCTYSSATGKISCNSDGGVGGTTPGGAEGDIQFKYGTTFAGDSDLNWNSSTNALTITNGSVSMVSTTISLATINQGSGDGSSVVINSFYNNAGTAGTSTISFQTNPLSTSYGGIEWRVGMVEDMSFRVQGYDSGTIIAHDILTINGPRGTSPAYWNTPLIGLYNTNPSAILDIISTSTVPIFEAWTSTTKPTLYIANKGQVGIGTTTPALALSIEGGLQLGPTTTVPTAINGTMYYDSSTNKFTCYQNGGWTDCISSTATPAGSDSYVQYNNSSALGGERYFVYDDTNRRLGIGTSTPTSTLEVYSSTTNPILSISGGENSALDPAIRLSVGSGMPVPKIKIGYDTSETDFRIVKGDDLTATANIGLEINDSLEVGIGTSSRSSYALNTVTGFFETGISVNYLFSVQHDGTAATVIMSGAGSVFNMAGAGSLFQINGNINYGGALTNAYPDLAEKFPTQDNVIEPGDVVAVDTFNKENIVKTNSEYQENAMGVVSTRPGIIMGGLIKGEGRDVALAGRIPVKVNLNNGDIKAGDYLTSSDIPGVAMKATKAGKVLGMAMEDYAQTNQSNGQKTIIMFVEPHYVGNDLEYTQTTSGNIITQAEATLENIKTKLSDIGIIINANGYLEATTIKSKRMETEEIELTDKTTGEIYCIWYQNGARQEQKGRCEDIFGTSDVPASAQGSGEAKPTDTSTTSTDVSITTDSTNTSTTTTDVATTTEPIVEQPTAEPTIQTDTVLPVEQVDAPVSTPTPEAVSTETPASVRQPADSGLPTGQAGEAKPSQ